MNAWTRIGQDDRRYILCVIRTSSSSRYIGGKWESNYHLPQPILPPTNNPLWVN